MKKIALMLAMVCTVAQAEPPQHSTCAALANFAGLLAQARDKGVPRDTAISLIVDHGGQTQEVQAFFINMANTIYLSPEYSPERIVAGALAECAGISYEL